ncbi:MAG: ABC transporter permease [Phycisphaeraceae bacterium]|nr:ABC transporter permease [Phycisphaeraceae bacterium]
MFLFMIWPIVLTVRGGFVGVDGRFTFGYVASIYRDPVMLRGLFNSLSIATFTTLLCLLLTLPLAVLAVRCDFRGKRIATSLIMVPLILPPFVGAIGIRAVLGRFGALNALLGNLGWIDPESAGIDFLGGAVGGRFWGVVIMEALHLYPITFLNLTAALANLDPTLDEAARGVGAGGWRRFRRITLPLIMPGVFAGTTIVFIWSFTELGTPLMFDYYTVTPVQIFWGISEVQSNPRPYALVVVMLAHATAFYLIGKVLLGRQGHAMQTKASIAGTVRRLGPLAGLGAAAAFAVTIGLALLPHVGVVLSAFSIEGGWYRSVLPDALTFAHFENALGHGLASRSIRNSLLFASMATALAVVIGTSIAYLNVRLRVRGGWLLDGLAMLPLAVPGLVMAFGYVAMTLHWPFNLVPQWASVVGTNPNQIPLLVIAYAIRRLPYVVRSASAGLEQTSVSLEEAAHNLGGGTLYTVRRITVPLIGANLIAGAILAFSFSMLEVSDSLILARKQEDFPITKAIYELFQRLGDGPYIASAMGVWGMALLSVTLIGASILMGRRLGAIFRI